MTEKLYDLDGHRRQWEAQLLSCAPREGAWAVTLDKTAFFPGGGGQAADTGALSGVAVVGMREEAGELVHLCAAALPVGEAVHGALDWETRFARMQLHSGEHLVSGLAHRLWGCENVGFHMAPGCVTLDFDRELDAAQLRELERRANEAVWENLPVRCFYPDAAALAALDYRSKKELRGPVRLVEIEGLDRCACCAPHVSRTGELGLIRLTDALRHRGGIRLSMKAGRAAWEDARACGETAAALAASLSAPADALLPAVERLRAQLEETRAALSRAAREQLEREAAQLSPTQGSICYFTQETDGEALRAFVNAAGEKCRLCALFSGAQDAWRYVLGSRSEDMRALSRELNAALDGRGGGSRAMAQGSCRASREAIQRFFGG